MIKKDFHGWKLEDAIQEVHNIVGDVRAVGGTVNVEFITGHGVIRTSIILVLDHEYGIKIKTQLGNVGVLVATIE